MTMLSDIRSAMSLFTEPHALDNAHVVTTQYLYPSNEFVSVHVSKAMSGNIVVSDGGGALDVLSTHGIHLDDPKKAFSSIQREWGVRFEGGAIKTARLVKSRDLLANAMVTVARASAHIAEFGLNEYRPRRRRNLEAEIYTALQRHVSVARIHRNRKLAGESNRQYVFDFAVPMGQGLLIVDAVDPEPASLLAKFASHMDLARSQKGIEQRLVYDDSEDWKAEDLALMQMAAKLVPLSKLPREMRRIAP